MGPRYPLAWGTLLRLAWALAAGGQARAFRADALDFVRRLGAGLRVEGQANIPQGGPGLLTVNHYSAPAFRAWWLPLTISAVVPAEVHWVMTAAWTFPDPLRAGLLTPLTRRLFARLARVYAFTAMPPMPPDPRETEARAAAVRQVLGLARRRPQRLIGLAPEGMDMPGGVLGWPPAGVGRFIAQLAGDGRPIVPVGAFEGQGQFWVRFGPAFHLGAVGAGAAEVRDREISHLVMRHLAALLPPDLRGEFQPPVAQVSQRG